MDQIDSILRAASLAPSPDNNQPWGFGSGDGEVQVYHRRDRAVLSDVRDLFSWLAIGAAVENIVLAAGAEGLSAEVEYHLPVHETESGEHVATIRLGPGGEADPLADRIEARHTNRQPFTTGVPDPAALEQIRSSIRAKACELLWIAERPLIKRVAKLVATADRVRFEDRRFHDELHGMLRFTEEEVEERRDGLDIRTLEVPRPLWGVLKFLRPWRRMRVANFLGASRSFARISGKQARSTGALGLLVTGDETDEGFLEAGRSLQRTWLAATAEDLAFHTLGSLPLFLLKLDVDRAAFTPKHALRLDRVAAALREAVPETADRRPIMLFRLGTPKAPPSARSTRYPPDAVRLPL